MGKRTTQTKNKGKSRPNPLKANSINDLQTEIERIEESSKRNPASKLKNKEKRRELVLMRNQTKNNIAVGIYMT